jgi:hypothetical protein
MHCLAQGLQGAGVRTQGGLSFSVRMKRSAQPMPFGARLKPAELSAHKKASSA